MSLFIPAGLLFAGCAERDATAAPREVENEARVTTTATITNMLPVDGCSYPVTIDGVDYAPDARSRRIASEIVPAGETITVELDYRLTGRIGTVECGFGNSQRLPEISFRVRSVQENA